MSHDEFRNETAAESSIRKTISGLGHAEKQWLIALSLMAPEPVPVGFCEAYSAKIDDPNWLATIREIEKVSLIEPDPSAVASFGKLVPGVREVVRTDTDKSVLKNALIQVAGCLDNLFASDIQDPENWPLLEPFISHVRSLLEIVSADFSESVKDFADLGSLGNKFGLMLHRQARFTEAEPFLRWALNTSELSAGPEDPDVAIDANNLADTLQELGRSNEAEALIRRALAIVEKTYGPEHPGRSAGLAKLGELLESRDRWSEAETAYREALSIDRKIYGPGNAKVATSLNNLGTSLFSKNRFDEAEDLFRQALAIIEKSSGQDHPDVATNLKNLAEVLLAKKRPEEAASCFRRALEIDRNAYGPDDPEVVQGLCSLANAWMESDRFEEAEAMYRQALAIGDSANAPDGFDFVQVMFRLANLLESRNRHTEAEELYRRASLMAIRKPGATRVSSSVILRSYLESIGKNSQDPQKMKAAFHSFCDEAGADPAELAKAISPRTGQG